MSELMPSNKNLILPGENNNGQQLILPTEQDSKDSPRAYETAFQKEVIGNMGLGSIRYQTVEQASIENNEIAQEKIAQQALKPVNILSLKENYDRQIARAEAESSFKFDKRVYRDDDDKSKSQAALKEKLIDQYLQTGSEPGKERVINPKLKEQIAKQMDLSYSELESRLNQSQKESKKNNAAKAPTKPTGKELEPLTASDVAQQTTTNNEPAKSPEDKVVDDGRYSLEKALEEAANIQRAEKNTPQEIRDIKDQVARFSQMAAIRERSGLRSARNPKAIHSLGALAAGLKITDQDMVHSQQVLERYRRHNNNLVEKRLRDAGADAKTINIILKLQDRTLAREIGEQITGNKLKLASLTSSDLEDDREVKRGFWSEKK